MDPVNLSRKSRPPCEGLHRARIIQIDQKTSKGAGLPYLSIQYSIEEPGEDGGKAVFDNMSLSEKARFRFDPFLDAVGAPEEGTMDPGKFVGQVIWITVKHEEYNNRLQPRIDNFYSEEAVRATPSLIERFNELNTESLGGVTDFWTEPDDTDGGLPDEFGDADGDEDEESVD